MINKLFVFGLLSLSLIMKSCIVYYPQTVDIPLISKKKDLRVDAGISTRPSIHTTVSYGLTDKIAIQGFGSFSSDDVYYFQAATGLYNNRGNSRVLELYGGFGYGHGNAYCGANPGNLLGDYQIYFGQFNYGKIANEHSNFEIGFGLKTGYLHSNFTDKNYYNWISEPGPFKTYNDKSLLIEPTGIIRVGGEKLRFSINLGGTMIYKFTNTDKHLPYRFINLGLGVNYRF